MVRQVTKASPDYYTLEKASFFCMATREKGTACLTDVLLTENRVHKEVYETVIILMAKDLDSGPGFIST